MAFLLRYEVGILALTTAIVVLTPANADRIIVGGSNHWRFGFDYQDWTSKNGPFYLNDTLVFMYEPPSNTTPPHSVYLLRDRKSLQACSLKRAKMMANVSAGGGQGFEFTLHSWRPLFFACGEHDGAHCRIGNMKFAVYPVPFMRCYGPHGR